MVKIHGIEDHLLDKIKEYNGIGCFIEEFIEQILQYGKVNEKSIANIRDRIRQSINHSKERILNDSEVK